MTLINPEQTILSKPLQARNGWMGIYVHYPYCYQKCDYCDFYSEGIGASPSSNESLLFDTYKKEFLHRRNESNQLQSNKVDTIFFGGGTPSKASPKHWKTLIEWFKNEIDIDANAEISLEANPEDLSSEMLDALYDAGINRLNVGVQTQNETGLQFLGRYVDREKYSKLKEIFYHSPIGRLGIDLMYGIPSLTKADFEKDLDYFLSFGLSHLSLYSLTMEKGTSYSRKVKDKLLPPPDEEIQREILESLPQKMKENGYVWYEVSNYCKPDQFSRHNLRYWMNEPYIGLGPGAHGFLDGFRYGNARNTGSYLKSPTSARKEQSTPLTEIAISLFRLFVPIDLDSFFQLYLTKNDWEPMVRKIESFQNLGLCDWDGKRFQWKSSALLQLDDLIFQLV